MDALARLQAKRPAAEVPRAEARDAEWVTPSLVAEVAFAERTAGGRVRHARFLGLRQDKPAREVRPETNMPSTETGQPQFEISHRDRVIFPEANVTKGALADYYATMGAAMLRWLARRPVSLVRCPQGTSGHCFFQKHDKGGFTSAVHHVPIREKDGGESDYLYVEDLEGVEACVQMGTIEFHGWGSTIDDLERPDRMVFDLDPDEGLDFADVRRAAIDLRDNLADIGLTSFAMLSGGKGVHVVVPLRPVAEWPAVKDFASRFAHALSENAPDRYTATMSKAKRKGRIFIDWLRNQRGSTSVLPYVVRARPGAPVATPVSWRELEGRHRRRCSPSPTNRNWRNAPRGRSSAIGARPNRICPKSEPSTAKQAQDGSLQRAERRFDLRLPSRGNVLVPCAAQRREALVHPGIDYRRVNVAFPANSRRVPKRRCHRRHGIADGTSGRRRAFARFGQRQDAGGHHRSRPCAKILRGSIDAGNFAQVNIDVLRRHRADVSFSILVFEQVLSRQFLALPHDARDASVVKAQVPLPAALAPEAEPQFPAFDPHMAPAQRSQSEAAVGARIFGIADPDQGFSSR
jgi:DNA ligase D-like protein (predicted polymerase)